MTDRDRSPVRDVRSDRYEKQGCNDHVDMSSEEVDIYVTRSRIEWCKAKVAKERADRLLEKTRETFEHWSKVSYRKHGINHMLKNVIPE
jgi:hypothetical protein